MKIDLRTKLIIVFILTSLSVVYQIISMQLTLIGITLIMLLCENFSSHRINRILHRLKGLSRLLITLFLLQLVFRQEGEVIWRSGFIQITSEGLNYALVSSLRICLIILIAGILFDLPYYEYLLAFKAWKLPYEISFLVATVIHFIPIFDDQFNRSREALQLRGIRIGKLPVKERIRAYREVIFPVLARAVSQIRYRAISLELRGFRLHRNRSYLQERKLSNLDIIIQISCIIIFLLIILLPVLT